MLCAACACIAQNESTSADRRGLAVTLKAGNTFGGSLSYQWLHSSSFTELECGIELQDPSDASNMSTRMALSEMWSLGKGAFQWNLGPSLVYTLDLKENGYSGHNFGLGLSTGPQFNFKNGMNLGLVASMQYLFLGTNASRGWGFNGGVKLGYRF